MRGPAAARSTFAMHGGSRLELLDPDRFGRIRRANLEGISLIMCRPRFSSIGRTSDSATGSPRRTVLRRNSAPRRGSATRRCPRPRHGLDWGDVRSPRPFRERRSRSRHSEGVPAAPQQLGGVTGGKRPAQLRPVAIGRGVACPRVVARGAARARCRAAQRRRARAEARLPLIHRPSSPPRIGGAKNPCRACGRRP